MAPLRLSRAALAGKHEAEVAIIGGGVAGATLALYLAAEGLDPLLVESASVGEGALGASAGIIAPQLVRTTPARVLARLGARVGADWLRLVGESGGHLFRLIAEHRLACEASPTGFVAPVVGRRAVARLRQIVEEWLPFRRDLSVLDPGETAALTGCMRYDGAILDASGGTVNPLLLARSLADRAEALGARLFERSPVTGIERVGSGWRATTSGGTVAARHLILCANGGNAALHPALGRSVLPMHIQELATAPIPPPMRAATLPRGHCMTDLELDIFSLRYADGARLVTALPARGLMSRAEAEALVNERLARMLAAYEPVGIDYAWGGTAWINSSLLPRLVPLDTNLIAVQACNGRGIATNAIVARELARMLCGNGRYRPAIPFEQPKPIAAFRLARHVPDMLLSATLWAKAARARLKPQRGR